MAIIYQTDIFKPSIIITKINYSKYFLTRLQFVSLNNIDYSLEVSSMDVLEHLNISAMEPIEILFQTNTYNFTLVNLCCNDSANIFYGGLVSPLVQTKQFT